MFPSSWIYETRCMHADVPRFLLSVPPPNQAISTAFQVLSDPDKRRSYDQFGDDEGPGAGGGQAHPFRHADVSPEEIFNMFFGMNGGGMGGGRPGNFRVYRSQQEGNPFSRYQQQQQQQHQRQGQQQNPLGYVVSGVRGGRTGRSGKGRKGREEREDMRIACLVSFAKAGQYMFPYFTALFYSFSPLPPFFSSHTAPWPNSCKCFPSSFSFFSRSSHSPKRASGLSH